MLREDIKEFIKTIPEDVTIVAATKYVGVNDMLDLYKNGITNFGENRTDAFLDKFNHLFEYDITWHFIGHLQKNKAKDIINKIDYLHSLDSLELAKIINKTRNKPLNCFIEVSVNLEESKNGVPYYDVDNFYKELLQYENINVIGLMMMAIKADNDENLKKQFNMLNEIRNNLEEKFNKKLPYLSMGMSDDYKIALECGATHIRLGRILWKN